MQITVVGVASKREIHIPYSDADLSKKLLDFLRGNGIPIASSCDGEGICKKCGIQNGWLSCEMTLEEFLQRQKDQKVFVDYL